MEVLEFSYIKYSIYLLLIPWKWGIMDVMSKMQNKGIRVVIRGNKKCLAFRTIKNMVRAL